MIFVNEKLASLHFMPIYKYIIYSSLSFYVRTLYVIPFKEQVSIPSLPTVSSEKPLDHLLHWLSPPCTLTHT